VQEVYQQEGINGLARRLMAKILWYFYSPFANLEQLAKRHGTDKGAKYHTFKGVNYIHLYEKYFQPFRNKHIRLLEIGVYGGGSLRMWKHYFSNAKIYGLDIDPGCKQHEEDRISVEIGSQGDESVLEKVWQNCGELDIVIDDGSHVNKHILASFNYFFDKLKPGGIYVIEDLGCSYGLDEDYVRQKWPGMKYNDPNEHLINNRDDLKKVFEKIIYDLDHFQGEILSIQFWNNICFILKAQHDGNEE